MFLLPSRRDTPYEKIRIDRKANIGRCNSHSYLEDLSLAQAEPRGLPNKGVRPLLLEEVMALLGNVARDGGALRCGSCYGSCVGVVRRRVLGGRRT